MRHRETTTDPYASVGKHVMAECEQRKVSYKYACVNKIRPVCDIHAEKLDEHFENYKVVPFLDGHLYD